MFLNAFLSRFVHILSFFQHIIDTTLVSRGPHSYWSFTQNSLLCKANYARVDQLLRQLI